MNYLNNAQDLENNGVIIFIENRLGSARAKMYRDSAPFFNAVVETNMKGNYFIESSMFTCSDGEDMPRAYKLKCVGLNVLTVKDFKNRNEALTFYANMEFTSTGALILERSLVSNSNVYYSEAKSMHHYNKHYDNGYSALVGCGHSKELFSYCEGDTCLIHSYSCEVYDNELQAHINHFNSEF
tara:strand:- start:48 stop:596 length:549 start_codon:yes stop_codon:yes gene_type:complete